MRGRSDKEVYDVVEVFRGLLFEAFDWIRHINKKNLSLVNLMVDRRVYHRQETYLVNDTISLRENEKVVRNVGNCQKIGIDGQMI